MRQFVKHSNHLASLLLGLAVLTGCVGTQTYAPVAVSTKKAKVFTPDPAAQARVIETYGQLSLRFEANQGQTDPQVKFLSRGRGYTLFLTPSEAVLALKKSSAASNQRSSVSTQGSSEWQSLSLPLSVSNPKSKIENPKSAVLRMQLVGGNPEPQVMGLEELSGISNYFIGNDPKKWRTDVSHYARVKYREVYPGIDLIYYGRQGQLEFDFVLAPGADPKVIEMSFGGADRLEVGANGALVVHTGGGQVQFKKPLVYQEVGGRREKIGGEYVLRGSESPEGETQGSGLGVSTVEPPTYGSQFRSPRVGFQIAAYDASKPLVIDPVLTYSTYLGGSDRDIGAGIAIDTAGNMYVAGGTSSTDFPTANPLQAGASGSGDAFVAKLNAAGSALVYSTYLGGSDDDGASGISVDSAGNVYVTGQTTSTDFPTANPIQASFGGGIGDAFVAKLNATGSALVYSTYLGGSGRDDAGGIAVDTADNAYVTGRTESTDFPTVIPIQPANAGDGDAFITKLNAAGTALVYSTYLGGSEFEDVGYSAPDVGQGIAVDSASNVYVTGTTYSTDFPTVNPIQPAYGGHGDAFIAKLNSGGTALIYSTYLGGRLSDGFGGIAVDADGNVYVTGDTASDDFPTVNPINAFRGGEVFITKLNAAGTALIYSTYVGGKGGEGGGAIAVDTDGNAYVGGSTDSVDFPTVNAIQADYPGSGLSKPFILKLNAAGSALVYSTYLGGSANINESALSIVVDGVGNAYVTGGTGSTDYPTVNPLQPTIGGSLALVKDAFVAKIGEVGLLFASVLPASRSVQVGTPATAFATIINAGTDTAIDCSIAPLSAVPTDFVYQTTDPATNAVTGTVNTPVDIAGGNTAQSFVIAFTPTAAFGPTDVQLSFDCTNSDPAPIFTGLNTVLVSASDTSVPDIVALGATINNDGIVNLASTGVFAVATVNVGATGTITASADTGSASLPVTIRVCETDPTTGACTNPITPTTAPVTTTIAANETPTFGIFVDGTADVPFDPANNRVFVRFEDSGGVTRGATSVAVRTQP